ncbi:MAG TPA: molecular chaperone DnaK, partial [bacterium]|nr:molecular chaperone DnaK [bacterium]
MADKIAAVKAVKDGEDVEAIKSATDALNKDAQAIGAKMYQQNPPAGDASAAAGASADQSTAKDAEFTEEKPSDEPKA